MKPYINVRPIQNGWIVSLCDNDRVNPIVDEVYCDSIERVSKEILSLKEWIAD